MVSNTSTEQLSLLFRLAIASVNGFRLVRSGTGSKKSLLRLKQSPGTVDGWPPWVAAFKYTTDETGIWWWWAGKGGNQGETPLPTGSRKALLTPPGSFLPAETSHVFPIFSLIPAFPNTWTGQWNQGRREFADKTLYRKGYGAKNWKKHEKVMQETDEKPREGLKSCSQWWGQMGKGAQEWNPKCRCSNTAVQTPPKPKQSSP